MSRYTVRAVVVGADINGLGVLRSLARAGVPVVIVDSDPDRPAMRSRYGRKWVYQHDAPEDIVRSLETLADERPGERAVLFFTEEETVTTAARYYDCLANRYHLTMSRPEALTPLLHKHGMRAVAKAIGAPLPRTRRIQSTEQLAEIDSLSMPVVIKPAVRDHDYMHTFQKAYRVLDRQQARTRLEHTLPVLPDMLVQEWVAGTDSDLYFCLQYLPADDRPISFIGRKIRAWPPYVGGTASCTPAPEARSIESMTTRFFRQAGITGLASMEYKRDPASGEFVLVEPTVGRTDFQQEVATLNGVNLPLVAYCDLLGYPLPRNRQSRRVYIWRERDADKQSAQSTPAGQTRWPHKAEVVNALWRVNDPWPSLVPLGQRVRNRLKRLAGRNLR